MLNLGVNAALVYFYTWPTLPWMLTHLFWKASCMLGSLFPSSTPSPLPGVLHRIDANCLHVVIRSQTCSATLRAQMWTNPHKLCHVTLGLSQPLSWPQFLHLRNRKMICKVLFLSEILCKNKEWGLPWWSRS